MSFFGCKSEPEAPTCLTLPDNKPLTCATVASLDSLYDLTYQHYQGFTGSREDSLLKNFTVLLEDHGDKVGNDVASKEYIESLRGEKIVGLRFDIPALIMSHDDVVKYVAGKYPNLEMRTKERDQATRNWTKIEFFDGREQPPVTVEFAKGGLATFVELKCLQCSN